MKHFTLEISERHVF